MCGITGIWAQHAGEHRIRKELTEAVARLRHRGPDDHGIWIGKSGIAFGHTRLSILDLSECGHQPMVSPDGRFVIVFNGEIYNFADIRNKLIAAGHSFAGSGDTEVILHAIKEWGSDAVKQFIGMFAIALWDEQEEKLELIRDRVGVKPLYYGWNKKDLCFGSELKALRAFSHWAPEIDSQSLGEFLQYGYIAADRTIYKDVFKLLPGHRLILRNGRQPIIEAYWSILDAPETMPSGSDSDIEMELEELLIDSFRYRMVSDVPVGVFLSGGIDSSLVTSVLAKHYEQTIRTFTVGFAENSHDESRWASKVASHCGTDHTEYILDVGEALEIAKDWGALFDEPFGDSSGIPTLLVSRLASRDVKVVLSADGGDELFSGYKVYASVLQRLQQLHRVPEFLRQPLSEVMSWLSRSFNYSATGKGSSFFNADLLHRLNKMELMLSRPTAGNLMDIYQSYWKPGDIDRLIGRYESPRPSADVYPGPPSAQISLWDFYHYLPEDILTKVDRATMAVSIEGREPLLDHRLVEFALNLPPHLRRGELGSKHLLKRILYRYVPREMVDRPKQGFAIPLDKWLRTDLKKLVDEFLSESRIRDAGIMDPALVRQLHDGFYRGTNTLSSPLWFLLAFEMWREHWC